ncbi:hypothetical protein [Pyrolobus fumarii]|uniref:hypothetical protein n=1 Tax=Pyrolobus fumarii TaxID=54252 RepID=UPI00064EE4F4|nr:hypothetical protein [Pyrolobus fumarii]
MSKAISEHDNLAMVKPLVSEEEIYLDIEAMIKLMAITVRGLELAVGQRSAMALGTIMGSQLYKSMSPSIKGKNLKEALEAVNTRSFRIDVYKMRGKVVHEDPQTGRKVFYYVGRECPIRQILYHEDIPAGGTLCRIMCSFVEQLLADVLGGKYSVKLLRYGPNACFLRVEIVNGPQPPDDVAVYSKKPSLEEYVMLLREDLRSILVAFDATVDRVLGGNPTMSYMAGKRYGLLDGDNLLSTIGRTISVDEAITVLNVAYKGLLELSKEGDVISLERSVFHDLVEKLQLGRAVFIYRTLQGYLAGLLERLTGHRVDLRGLDEKATQLKILMR